MSYRLTIKTDNNAFPYGDTVHTVELINDLCGREEVVARHCSFESLEDARQGFKKEFNELMKMIEQLIPEPKYVQK